MYQAVNIIVYAIPVFFLLIGLELLIEQLKKTNYYKFNDAVTNISCGIGQQVTGIFLKILVLGSYIFVYEHFRLIESIPNNPLVWLLLFIGVDFFYYWFHRLAHEISILWGSHVVHHQSEEYNLTVALRQSWLQGAFSWVFYIPLALIGFDPVLFIIINQIQTLYQFWIHTKTIDKMPTWFEYIFNTPSHHRVHHGVNPKYIDRNHGGTLIIFDRIFGTFQAEEEEVVYGITKGVKSWNPLWVNFEYWIDIFKDAWRASKWSDKLKILLKPPGWKPQELGGIEQPQEVSAKTFKKYQTLTPIGLNYYILFQYLLLLAGASVFLFGHSIQGSVMSTIWLKVTATVFIVLSLVNLGGIFESKKWVRWVENLRLIIVAGLLLFLFWKQSFFIISISAIVIILGISLIWFNRYAFVFNTKPQAPAP